MKKIVKRIILVIGFATMIWIAAYAGYHRYDNPWDDTEPTKPYVQFDEHSDAGATKTACSIFTNGIAAKILGSGATKGELPAGASVSTDDLSVTNCLYEIDDPDSEGILTASVLVRGGKTATGKTSNEFGFDNNKKLDAQGGQTGTSEPISGIGDAAYFSPAFGQVNVLVDDGTYWLIMRAATREQTEQLAKLITGQINLQY